MMTLDEAIQHCYEKVEEEKKAYEMAVALNIPSEGCLECALEHEQLADWLTKLKKVQDICEHWNDNSSSFVSACNAFEDILHIFNMGVGDSEVVTNETDN